MSPTAKVIELAGFCDGPAQALPYVAMREDAKASTEPLRAIAGAIGLARPEPASVKRIDLDGEIINPR